MSQERNAALDCAKGIGIVLVVYGHVARGLVNAGLPLDKAAQGLADSVIYSFHMPLFFFISGTLFLGSLARRGWGRLVLNKLDTVFYPYVVWSLFQGLSEVLLSRYTNGSVSLGQVFSLLWTPRAQFWFLYTLFVIFIFSGFLYRRIDNRWAGAVLAMAALIHAFGLSPLDIYAFNSFSHWFVFFALGVSAAPWLSGLSSHRYPALAMATAVFVAGQWVFHETLGLRMEGSDAPWLKLLLAFGGIAILVALGDVLHRLRFPWLAFLGRHSMEIYLAHIIAASGVRVVLQKFLGVTDIGVHVAAGVLCGIGLPLVLMVLSRRGRFGCLFQPPRALRFDRRPGPVAPAESA